MFRSGSLSVPAKAFAGSAVVLAVALVVGIILKPLIASGDDAPDQGTTFVPLVDQTPIATLPVSTPAVPVAEAATPLAATPEAPVALLTPEELKTHQPNELGVIPILEYHIITTNPEEEAQFVRLADDMRADLQWLYDNNFYVVPLRDVVNNAIAAPAGKHPVVLTFDDGTSSQFRFIEDENGELVPHPDTAIGILEAFYEKHPDFGRGGHFGLLVYNAFSYPEEDQHDLFEQKIAWMVERGYEIGNHTWQHTNLTDIPNDEFLMTITEPMIWADEIVGDVPENASRILTLPYGSTPDGDLHPDQREMMRHGYQYNGETYQLQAALLVGANPTASPASTLWDPMWVPRIQMFDESTEFWFGIFERGETVLYTSDGNPDTITVPSPLPSMLEGQLDAEALTAAGKTVVQYDPATGQQVAAATESDHAVTRPVRRDVSARTDMVSLR